MEEERGEHSRGENLFSLAGLDGMPVKGRDGEIIAHAVDALAACGGGRIGYVIVREGGKAGLHEKLRRLPWSDARVGEKVLETGLDAVALARLPEAAPS